MPRSRSRPKQKKTRVKVRAKPVTKKARIASDAAAFFDRSSLTYDTSESQFANYARLGLLADANQIGAKRDTILGFKPRVKGLPRRGAAAGPSGVATTGAAPHPLEAEVPPALKTVRRVPDGERAVLRKLLARHADDFDAMARDGRLNQYQHTAAHLRRRVAKLALDDADAAAAAADAGRAPPTADEPRATGLRKLTRDPNPAFRKRSMHFT